MPAAAPPGGVRSVRLRLLGVQAALLSLGLLLAMLGARQVLLGQLDDRIDRELGDQVARFRGLAAGVDPETGRPFIGVERLLRVHLTGLVVDRNETVLVLAGGRPYGRSLGSPPVRLGDPPGVPQTPGRTPPPDSPGHPLGVPRTPPAASSSPRHSATCGGWSWTTR